MQEVQVLDLYWEPECGRYLEAAVRRLQDTFPGLRVELASVRALDGRHYDGSRFQYDAVELLEGFPPDRLCLYLVHRDLYHPGYRYLYGAALPGRAVVSDFRPDTQEGFLKEVCHELGHALGLPHCRRDCVMHPSASEGELERKSPLLCRECRKKLQK